MTAHTPPRRRSWVPKVLAGLALGGFGILVYRWLSAPAGRHHVVRPGETLGQIGEMYGVPWRRIAEVNKLSNPDLILPGQVLTLPVG